MSGLRTVLRLRQPGISLWHQGRGSTGDSCGFGAESIDRTLGAGHHRYRLQYRQHGCVAPYPLAFYQARGRRSAGYQACCSPIANPSHRSAGDSGYGAAVLYPAVNRRLCRRLPGGACGQCRPGSDCRTKITRGGSGYRSDQGNPGTLFRQRQPGHHRFGMHSFSPAPDRTSKRCPQGGVLA